MSIQHLVLVFLVISPFAVDSAEGEQSLTSVKSQIDLKVKKIQTVQFKVKHVSLCVLEFDDNAMAAGEIKFERVKKSSELSGSMKIERRGDSYLFRLETTWKSGDMPDSEFKSLGVSDGKVAWKVEKLPNRPPIYFKNASHGTHNILDLKGRRSRKRFEQELLADEEIDGKKAWRIGFRPIDPQERKMMPRFVVWFDQSTGLEIKKTEYDEEGEVTDTTTYSDFKLNEKIDPKEFEFTPPPDADVNDFSK